LTIALSTRGRGTHSALSGVATAFRLPRFANIATWTVIVDPSAESVARVTPPYPFS
jgi:hypothetical protein